MEKIFYPGFCLERQNGKTAVMPKKPFVSILVPVRNESVFMKRSLEAIFRQDYSQENLEVILADGMSEDGTREIIRGFEHENKNLKLIDNPGKIVSAGLNLALQQAKGEIIVRVDGHCEIAPDYISRCVELLEKGEADMAGGPIETIGETPAAQSIALAMSSFFGVGGSAFRTLNNQKKYADTAAFFAAKKKVLAQAGFFDEELVRNQDDEYNYRFRKLGYRILLDPSIRSRYYSRSSLMSLWKQYFQYGFWKVRVLQKHPRQMQWRQFVPLLFVLGLLLSFFAGFFYLAAGIYLTADTAASLWVSRYQLKYFILLIIIFPVLHLSYGIGFLIGLVKFWNHWGES